MAGCGTALGSELVSRSAGVCWHEVRRHLQKALEMLVTARKAGAKPRDLNTSMDPLPIGFSIPTSTTVMRTATKMEMQAL